MNKADAIRRLFEASGCKGDSRRATIYLEQTRGWRETVVDAGVTRLLGRWPHVSLPPIAKLLEACREVDAEDRERHRMRQADAPDSLGPRMSEPDKKLCRLMRELFDEGLDWCERRGAWVPVGEAEELSVDDPDRKAAEIASAEEALGQVMRGVLKGNSEVRARREGWRKAAEKRKRRSGEPEPVADPLDDALAAIFD